MSTVSMAYLVLCIATFVGFAATLFAVSTYVNLSAKSRERSASVKPAPTSSSAPHHA